MQGVIVYIDGFNLYYGLRSKNWKRYYWLNVRRMAQLMLKPDQSLARVKYFTSIVSQPPDRHRRQATFLDALSTLSDLHIYYGHFLWEDYTCWNCGDTHRIFHEKMTDVNIATQMMRDAFEDEFDTALLCSADSDLVAPVVAVTTLFPTKRIVVAFPPGRSSSALMRKATACTRIYRSVLAKSQFPDEVKKPDGYVLRRPAGWR
jgi:uncharacterized LabA/DUF88 family protein